MTKLPLPLIVSLKRPSLSVTAIFTALPGFSFLVMLIVANTAYYFYYERESVTTLDYAFLATVQTKAERYTIYADLCAISQETLRRHNITFKKIPRDIARL